MTSESGRSNPDATSNFVIGRDNVQIAGLDINGPVFVISAILVVAFVAGTLANVEQAAEAFLAWRIWITTKFDWLFMMASNFFVIFCLAVAFSRLGRVRLGGSAARPKYSYPAWLAMLFAAGVGIGLMFFGVLEPVTHMVNPPLGIDPGNTDAARAAGMSASIAHWGLHAWAIYAVVGLSLAFFCFNRGLPLTLRAAFHPLIGDAVWGPSGHIIDVTAVLATLFGLATSLGLGAEQIGAGLNYLFDIAPSGTGRVLIVFGIIGIALVSVIAGLDKGVKRLSQINMVLASILALFVLVTGPTVVLLKNLPLATIDYAAYLPALSNWVGREDLAFYHGWSTFYWAWWIAWSPFVGMFIARVSYGRTVREFVTWALILPTVIGIVWMGIFGGTAQEQLVADGYTGVADSVAELALFKMLEGLPLTEFVSGLALVLIAIFFVTSADSGSLVLDTITAGGKMDAPVRQRIFWCVSVGLVAIALLLGGGIASLQALTICVALPFCVILILLCVSLLRGLREEPG